jgi:membrane fusion protein (multidrug efflux system)
VNRLRLHPLTTLIVILLLVLAGLVTFKLTSIGAKSDQRKGRLITVGTVTPIRQDLDVRLE